MAFDPNSARPEGSTIARPAFNPATAAPAPPEEPGLLRQGADLLLDFAQGGMGVVGAGAAAFGADNVVAKGAGEIAKYAAELQSQQRQAERQGQAERMQAAEATGSMWEEAKAAGQNFLETPGAFTASAVGSLVPTAAAALVGGAPAAALTGGGIGAGAVKQSIYERIEQEALKAGQTPEQAAATASAAQAYTGENWDQIALGAGLGVAAGGTGVERLLGGGASAIKNIIGRTAAGAVSEAIPEAAQGGQERLAANVAAQREGFGGDTWTGVVGQGVTEGLASVGPGGIAGAMTPYIDPNAGPISRAAIKAQEQQSAGALPAPGQLSGDAAVAMGDSVAGQDPSGAYALQQRNTELQSARTEQEAQRASIDLDYLDQVNGWEPGTAFRGAQQRLAELEQAVSGTEDQQVTGPDGQQVTIPGEQPRYFTPEEKQEYDALRQAMASSRQGRSQVGGDQPSGVSPGTTEAAGPGLPFTQPPYAGPTDTNPARTGADPRVAIAGEPIADPAAQLAIERPSVEDQFLEARRKRAQGELLSQTEAAILNGPDPFEGRTVSLAAPTDPVGVARRDEAVQDVAFANGDDPANVRVFSSQDLPDGPSGNQRGAGLSRSAASVIEGVGRIFGTEYRFYDSPNSEARGGGFVLRGRRPGVAYVRAVEGDAAPLVVAGHETYHTFTPAERARFSAAIEPFVDASDTALLSFLSDYTGGRYQTKALQLVQAGVSPTEVIESVIAQAQQDGVANLDRAKLREEFDADIFGNRMKDTGFWEKVFSELKAQDRTLLVKIRDSIKQVIGYLKSQAGKVRGFNTDQYIRDLDAVQRIAARTLLSAANTQQKSERGSRAAGDVVRSGSRDRIGPYPTEGMANMNKDWLAKKEGAQYALEQAADGFYLTRTGATNEGQGQANRGRAAGAVPDAERRGSRDAAPDVRQRAAGGSEPAARQSRAPLAVESRVRTDAGGRVSLTGVHFSRQPRAALSGSYYGTGLKGAEGRRLQGASDRRLLSRVYAYVNEGKGVRPEAGVGSYPHTVELSNLYDFVADPLKLLRKHQGDLNAVESAILDEGFDGYYVRDAFGNQGAAVLLGDASIGVRATPVEAEVMRSPKRTLDKENEVSDTVDASPVAASATRNAETIDDHLLKVERDLRELAETTRLSAAEKAQIKADAKKFGFTIKEVELEVRRIKSRFPPEAGWAPITFNKIDEKTLKKKATAVTPLPVDAIFFDKIAYGFHQDAKGKADKKTQAARTRTLAQALAGEILAKYTAAQSGDANGQLIMRQAGWYRELRSKLRATFGGFADYLAQLLGPTSANNPVEPNFRYATEALALATSGRWDTMIKEALVWKADIEAAATVLDEVEGALTAEEKAGLKALKSEVEARFGKGNKSDERTEYIERRVAEISPTLAAARAALKDASVYKGREPLRDNGKRFGMATRGILEILADSWGDKKPGDAPKTKNYYQNIVGRTLEATIDVWAARTLRRLANEQIGNFPRIPKPAEQGVQGNILKSGDGAAGGEFGFGQDVFREAADELRKSGIKEFADTNASEVQAMIWFAEKELWARRDWTTKIGEGGSIEHELLLAGFMDRDQLNEWRVAARAGQPKAPEMEGLSPEKAAQVKAKWDSDVAKWQDAKDAAEAALREVSRYPDRFFAGATAEIPGSVPLDQEMANLGREIEESILSEPGVMAVRAQTSTGVFLADRERTLDIELVARNGYDVMPLAEKLREVGDREGQHATFLSRVLRPDEPVDPLRHRPGMELYFSEAISPAKAEELISVVQEAGFVGMTLATEGRRMPGALAGETQDVVGIRVQHIPEFLLGETLDAEEKVEGSDTPNKWKAVVTPMMSDRDIEGTNRTIKKRLLLLSKELRQREDVSTVEVLNYETEVNFYGDASRVAEGTPRGDGAGVWTGRSVREGLENADRFDRERGSDALESRRDRVREGRAVRRASEAQDRVVAQPGFDVSRSTRRLTESQAFKDWFGDSKMVARDGTPLTFMHGSPENFDAFDSGRLGRSSGHGSAGLGFFFTRDSSTAERYADGGNIYRGWLAIQRPYLMPLSEAQAFEEAADSARRRQELRSKGFDGVVILDDQRKPWAFVAFEPWQFKSVDNRGTFDAFDDGFLRSARRNELGFYSQLSRAVEGAKFQTQPAGQWKLWLSANTSKLGVKADEVQWSGLNEWLDMQGKRKVEKAEVTNFLEQGGVQVQEVARGRPGPTDKAAALLNLGWPLDDVAQLSDRELRDAPIISPEDLEIWLDRREAYEPTMTFREAVERAYDYGFEPEAEPSYTTYDEFVLPGGENYREVLLTLPETTPAAAARKARIVEIQDRAFREGGRDLTNDETVELANLRAEDTMQAAKAYQSNHWKGVRNVLAHLRMDDRTDAEGKRVLFVQEIQSDWGQDGRKKGFVRSDAEKAEWLASRNSELEEDGLEPFSSYEDAIRILGDEPGVAPTPTGPFVTDTQSWVSLALKRAVTMAAEQGYDRVALINGEQAAGLYDLRRNVDEIEAFKRPDGVQITGRQAGQRGRNFGVFPAEGLANVVGEELAEKIVKQETPLETYRGQELAIGGEGMKAFYDRLVPQVARDVLKKIGGKVAPVRVDGVGEQVGFDITPEMREKIANEGLPLFSASRAASAFGDISQAQEAALRAVGLLREPKTIRERFADLTDNLAKRLTQGVVDQYAPLKELDFRSYVLARMSKGTDGTFEATLYYGRPKINGDTVEIDTAPGGLMDVLSTLSGEQDRFLAWIAANRAERLSGEGREFLFTPDQIRELKGLNQGQMSDGRSRAVEYGRVLREFNAFQDSVLAIAETRGLIDPESRQVWKDGFYVPFYRNMEDGTTGPSVKSGLVNQYAFKKLKGSSRQLNEDLLANTLQNMAHLLSAAAKNQAAMASLRAAESAGVAHRVPSGTKGAVRFLDGGREQHYLVDDPFIFDAITSLESVKVVGLEKVLSKFKHWLTMGVTINPAFQLRSLMRDAIQSVAITKIDANPLANVKQGIASQMAKDQDYINALASGGLIRFNSLLEGNRADHTRKLIKMGVADSTILDTREKVEAFFTKALDKWLAVGDISESTNRMALYKQLIAKGEDPLLAAYQARDLMDFSMQGQWRAVRFLTQVVPFLNARLQGLYKLGRDGVVPTAKVLFGGGNATDKQIAKRFGAVTAAVAMASIALMAAYEDDEDWKKREDWDRDTYWWFKIGDTAFRIPKPFEVGAIGTIAERTAELFMADEMTGSRFLQRLGHMMSSTFALNPIPQMVKPLLDVYSNEDSFTQRPIETMGMERLQPQDRFTGQTSELAKWLGQMGLPEPGRLMSGQYQALSPVQIDALIRGYFSWLGVSATRIIDEGVRLVADRPARPEMQLRDVFFAGNFVEGLPANSSRYVTALYDQSKAIEAAYASYRFALRQGDTVRAAELLESDGDKIRLNPMVSKAKQTLARLNENVRAIERDMRLSPAEKRAQIDRIKAMQNQIAARISAALPA